MEASDWTDSISLKAPFSLSWPVRLFDLALLWLERSRQRAALGRLDERLLRDIGCNRASAVAESDKPFWQE
ncbi:MAG: DUF1127 domain-containing protein [Magnetospirillum sp.]|nr:DUF1127 domain-containing protein [Magnetospirillum sp.]